MPSYCRSSNDTWAPTEDRWMNQKIWGFRIYRTTYQDQDQWQRFMAAFKSRIEIHMSWRDHDPPIYDSERRYHQVDHERTSRLDLFVIEGLEFDGMGRPALIEHFNKWVRDLRGQDEVNEEEYDKVFTKYRKMSACADSGDMYEQRVGQPQFLSSPRYRFFIEVSQECVESVLDAASNREGVALIDFNGWVNIVNAQWSFTAPVLNDLRFRPSPRDPDIVFDNGCWFRATPSYLYPYLYAALCWTDEYLRPPRVVSQVIGGFSPEHDQNVEDIRDDIQVMLYSQDRRDGIWCYDDSNPEPLSDDEADEADESGEWYEAGDIEEYIPAPLSEEELEAKRAREDEENRDWLKSIQLNIDDNSDFATNWTRPYTSSGVHRCATTNHHSHIIEQDSTPS